MRKFRLATEADAQELVEIYAPYVRDTSISFEMDAPSVETFAKRIRDISAIYPFIVAQVDEKIVGYAYASRYKERAAYRWNVELSVYLLSECHGHGLGRMLMNALMEILGKQGVRMAYSCITLPNAVSVAMHEKLGFHKAGVLADAGWKLGKWREVVWFEKRLGKGDGKPSPVTPVGDMDAQAILDIYAEN